MDYSTVVKRSLRRIAEAIEGYAKSQGWNPDDYRWYYRLQLEWNHIHILFGSRAFDEGDYYDNYKSIRSFLDAALEDEPGLSDAIGIAIRDFKQLETGDPRIIGSDYEEYEDFWAFRPVRPSN